MYTIETLKVINPAYDYKHRLTQNDVDVANMYVELIEQSRTDNQIQVGDIIKLTTKYGDYYSSAHVERYIDEDGYWTVCEQPHIPFVEKNIDGSILCNTSGGAWTSVPKNLKLLGKRRKLFQDFGHCGACANGAFSFEAEVNVWEYKQDEPLYGDYSTMEWDKAIQGL